MSSKAASLAGKASQLFPVDIRFIWAISCGDICRLLFATLRKQRPRVATGFNGYSWTWIMTILFPFIFCTLISGITEDSVFWEILLPQSFNVSFPIDTPLTSPSLLTPIKMMPPRVLEKATTVSIVFYRNFLWIQPIPFRQISGIFRYPFKTSCLNFYIIICENLRNLRISIP